MRVRVKVRVRVRVRVGVRVRVRVRVVASSLGRGPVSDSVATPKKSIFEDFDKFWR